MRFALEHREALSYLQPYASLIEALLQQGEASWGRLRWFLHCEDFRRSLERSEIAAPHAIFYDPYSASSNPEMWTLEHFQRLRNRLSNARTCLLSNYTRSTAVRCTWLLAGFFVGLGVGIGAKEETTVASNRFEALERPLSRGWLKQVAASQNANPLRQGAQQYGPIGAADFQALEQHEQFRVFAPT